VGFITVTANGTGGTQSNAITLAGLGLTQPVLFQGVFEPPLERIPFVDTGATFTDNEFNVSNGTGNACYLEITSGTNAGVLLDIASTTAATQTINYGSGDTNRNRSGDSFAIRQHWTIGSVFWTDQTKMG